MDFTLSQNSQTDLSIVTADRRLAFAADELARYLAIITGAQFPLVPQAPQGLCLHIRDSEQGHGWDVRPDGVTLFGNDALGVLHAIYHFLETHCGCRWLSEGEGGEIIPRHETLTVPCEQRRYRPAFAQRAFTNYPDLDHRTVAMCDWMAKNRFNRFMIFANVDGAFEAYRHVLRREVMARGLKVELGHHSCQYFVPPAEFFAAHPEYFAQINGERTPNGQLCTSHPEVISLVAERIGQVMSEHPEIDTVGLWPNDGYGWCECPRCLALEPQEPSLLYPEHPRRTDTYLRFVNEVTAQVMRRHPDRALSALAYVNYLEPPRQVELRPEVKLYFAPFQRCFRHPLQGDADCRRPNATYADLLRQWRRVVPGELLVFEYVMLIDMLSVPYTLSRLLPRDFRFYRDAGVQGWVLEYRPEEWAPYGQHARLIGDLAWNPETDVKAALRDYYASLYGPAAEAMGDFWATLDERFTQAGGCVHHYDLGYTRRATHPLLQPALEHLGRALAQAATGERRHRDAVAQAQTSVQLLMRLGRWQELRAAAQAMKEKAQDAAQAAAELVDFANRHAAGGSIYAPGVSNRVSRDMDV